MINPYSLEEAMKAHHQDLLRAAEHARLVRQAQAATPSRLARARRVLGELLSAWVQSTRAPIETYQE